MLNTPLSFYKICFNLKRLKTEYSLNQCLAFTNKERKTKQNSNIYVLYYTIIFHNIQ